MTKKIKPEEFQTSDEPITLTAVGEKIVFMATMPFLILTVVYLIRGLCTGQWGK